MLIRRCYFSTGEKIDTFMRSFIDERDSGSLILTHLYLLVGCAAPVWLYTPANPSEGTQLLSLTLFSPPLEADEALSSIDVHFLLPYLGVLLVGLGDSFASLAGMYLGRIKWPHTKKTVEGTMAAVAVVLLAGLLLSLLYPFVSLSFGQVGLVSCLSSPLSAIARLTTILLPCSFIIIISGSDSPGQ
jgi:dolichol kinase